MPWNGKTTLKLLKPLSYLVDNDLSPDIANALSLFGFDVLHVKEIPQYKVKGGEVSDPEIIQWCKDNGRVWITHDKTARKQHEVDIKAARIHVLWVRGHPTKFAAWQQFRIVVRVIDEMQQMLQLAYGAMHFRAGLRGTSRPKVTWTELPRDMPRN